MMRKTLLIMTAVIALSFGAFADEKDDRIAQLESEVAMLKERIAELTGEKPAPDYDDPNYEKPLPIMTEKEITPTCYLVGASGTTENGDALIIYSNGDTRNIYPISLRARDMDGSLLSYIYIDGELIDKEQLANTDTDVYVTGDPISIGVHEVLIKQYADNDEKGEVLFESDHKYEVKEK